MIENWTDNTLGITRKGATNDSAKSDGLCELNTQSGNNAHETSVKTRQSSRKFVRYRSQYDQYIFFETKLFFLKKIKLTIAALCSKFELASSQFMNFNLFDVSNAIAIFIKRIIFSRFGTNQLQTTKL